MSFGAFIIMSISSISPAIVGAAARRQTQPQSDGAADTASSQPADGAQTTSGTAPAAAPGASASAVVTLSPQAQAFSELASQGITVTQVSLSTLGITPDMIAQASTPDQIAAMMHNVRQESQNLGLIPKADGGVSQKDFLSLIQQFGGSVAQAKALLAVFDGNENGSISNSEMLAQLGSLSTSGTSSTSAEVLALMDGNRDGAVDSSEFLKFETAFVQSEQAPS